MKKISLKELYEKKIEELWTSDSSKEINITKKGYAIQDNQIINSLLFIGLNPSNSKNDSLKLFYNNDEGKVHKYFNRFIEISEQLNIPWSHIDLLYIRETNQNFVKDLLYNSNESTLEFIVKQLEMSKSMLELIKPSIIVVNNSLARTLLGFDRGWLNYTFEFNDDFGTHIITNKDSLLYGVPVFFTSMLTGQRALDKGSYRRLIWHIKFAINKLQNRI